MPLSAGNVRADLRRWVNHDGPRHTLGDVRNLEIEALNESIAGIPNVVVTSVNVNKSGRSVTNPCGDSNTPLVSSSSRTYSREVCASSRPTTPVIRTTANLSPSVEG